MCMSCNNTNKITKKKIMLFFTIVIVIGVATYFIFTTTNNSAIAATIPVILSFAACPLMCAPMVGLIWLINQIKKKKIHKEKGAVEVMNQKQQEKDTASI